MSTSERARRRLERYDDREPWPREHDEAMIGRDLDDLMGEGISVFRDLSESEGEIQAEAIRRGGEDCSGESGQFATSYRLWVRVSKELLGLVEKFAADGSCFDCLDDFRLTFQEVRELVGNLAMEATLPTREQFARISQPDNPDPARYGD